METAVLVEVTLATVVLCADCVAEERRRPFLHRAARGVLWPFTLALWFSRRSMAKLTRFGAIVWFLVVCGWLFTLEFDRAPSKLAFLLIAEATLAFVVYCVDAMSADLHRRPLRRALRSIVWVKAVSEYLRADDSIRLIHASVILWVTLTTGWLLTLMNDRLAGSLGWLPG